MEIVLLFFATLHSASNNLQIFKCLHSAYIIFYDHITDRQFQKTMASWLGTHLPCSIQSNFLRLLYHAP